MFGFITAAMCFVGSFLCLAAVPLAPHPNVVGTLAAMLLAFSVGFTALGFWQHRPSQTPSE